ncbi:hypothetical protein FSP39_007952 [Pinctada imbricata]|uniref:Uncharacterized protein n=1 Tax=Pinctada imbricata TaxID=66713 RepID=A0AA88YTP0_PINIB|nr:hypothetical protein FSP39_007952 [Pinctada imbricata]
MGSNSVFRKDRICKQFIAFSTDSVRDRRDVQKARITGPPGAAFIRYEIPPSRTDCTDAAYYRCIIDGTTLRFERVVFIQPEVEESYIEPLIIAPSNVRGVNTQRPDTGSSVYTAGTSVWLYCTARTGNFKVLDV